MYLAHLEKLNRTRLADVLVEEGVLDRARVEECLLEQDQTGKQLGQILIEGEIVTDYDLAKIVVTHYALPYLDVANYSMRREVVALLPEDFRHRWAIQPLDQFGTILTLAVTEVPSPELIDEIVAVTKLTPILFVASRRSILNVIEEEKKRAAQRTAKAAPKSATQSQKLQGGATKSGPVPELKAPQTGDLSLPDLELPTISMKLAGAGKTPGAAKPAAPQKATQSGALSWMDAVGGLDAAAAGEKAQVSKFPRPAAGAVPAGGSAARHAQGGSQAKPAAAPAPAGKGAPAPKTGAAANPAGQAGGGAWQSIFDEGDDSVKKPKE
jgi:hypothetical protein